MNQFSKHRVKIETIKKFKEVASDKNIIFHAPCIRLEFDDFEVTLYGCPFEEEQLPDWCKDWEAL